MSDTPRMGLPLIEAAQAQKHITHNEALVILDCLSHLYLQDRDRADPPDTPAEGEAWLVDSPASADWAGKEGLIASLIDGGWSFFSPFRGLRAYVADEQAYLIFDGTAWQDLTSLMALQNLPMLGVGTEADEANPLAARINNALFAALEAESGGDGDIRLKVNKEGTGNTASFLFQSGWSGRAEIGLCGDENFRFKVSPDGSQWTDALTIDAASGAVTLQGNVLWHEGNDGSGSGLDADLLDGNEASAFATAAQGAAAEAALPASGGTLSGNVVMGAFFGLGTPAALTISGGAITATRSYHRVDTESGAASDDLDTINGGSEGDILILGTVSSTRHVTVKSAVGNIFCATDRILNSVSDRIVLIRRGASWDMVSYTNN